jgi:hypothetical protein
VIRKIAACIGGAKVRRWLTSAGFESLPDVEGEATTPIKNNSSVISEAARVRRYREYPDLLDHRVNAGAD